VTLTEIVETYRRRAIEAAAVGSSAPLASVYEVILAELTPLAGENGTPAAAAAQADRWLTPAQVAEMLGTSVRWVYDHVEPLGGKRLSRRCLRFSEAAVRRHLERRR
jgi:predicted DNA-binding transcriptional regulator AlpA